MNPNTDYRCPKCGGMKHETGEIRVAGGFWSKIFDVQGKRLSTITCTNCKYTEFFAVETSMMGNVLDLLTS